MDRATISKLYRNELATDSSLSEALASISVLIKIINQSKAGTLVELRNDLTEAIDEIKNTDTMVTSISSASELFLRFITLTTFENPFEECKKTLIERGKMFLEEAKKSREKIAILGEPFITDGIKILIHGKSRVVLEVLKRAATESRKHFTVYVTQSLPDKAGHDMRDELQKVNIQSVVVLDAAVACIMEKVDLVLVGAEGVVESGGILNKIGTYSMGIAAKEMNKPLYVVAESFKFARIFPLNQDDIPHQFRFRNSKDVDDCYYNPIVDYTPPNLITLLFTDLGVLTPSAVSDELIKLYL
ncbi:unnamed protein product [Dimorphilus gyrociliatus]|uniref:Translation initiation factor eIF2B subunit alpha n=1 Tax=Dimorphilus gyrociliatus TaxID=2664684 RepID=A0A7I8V9T7_9ANNE|nr:unnamed protein product [Dimorphilus gyrociliatus]